ncbi:hypothetical protein BDZ91DRAFT_342635 [Kalaharituber pfeilii]|nr:hypothetical protein BDZ91DRAFT_342635 [Kalaharituber pfeilii]
MFSAAYSALCTMLLSFVEEQECQGIGRDWVSNTNSVSPTVRYLEADVHSQRLLSGCRFIGLHLKPTYHLRRFSPCSTYSNPYRTTYQLAIFWSREECIRENPLPNTTIQQQPNRECSFLYSETRFQFSDVNSNGLLFFVIFLLFY